MRRRLTLGAGAELIDRDGQVLGRLVSITVEIDGEGAGGTTGGVGDQHQQTSLNVGEPTTNESNNNKQLPPVSPNAEKVAAYWKERRNPKRGLSAAQARMITRALNENFTVEELQFAIDGLLASEWHREHDQLTLSALLATKPGGPALADKLERFIQEGRRLAGEGIEAKGPEGISPRERASMVIALRRELALEGSSQAQEAADAVRARLAELGLRAEQRGNTFVILKASDG